MYVEYYEVNDVFYIIEDVTYVVKISVGCFWIEKGEKLIHK